MKKTAKPNVGGFKEFKRTLLEWLATVFAENPKTKVNTIIAIPYNPYEPASYNRWTMRGMLDLEYELRVADEFWNFLGGEGTYQDLLGCFVFTETMGILLPTLSNEGGLRGKKAKRFYRCFFRLKSGAYLRGINNELKKQSNKNIYEHFRHSMAHRFLPTVKKVQNGQVVFVPLVVAKVGVFKTAPAEKGRKTPPIVLKGGRLTVMAVNYVNELKQAINNFYRLTFIEKDKNFQKAAIEGIDVLLRGKV